MNTAYKITPDSSCLGEPLEIYSTKKEAEEAIRDKISRMYGVDALYEGFKIPFSVKKVVILSVF